MNTRLLLPPGRIAWTVMLLLMAGSVAAAPGAHGPNGEHLDAPSQGASASAAPKLEAKSELFELVATLGGGELSILVDKFDTNEPVLGGQVEVESGSLKAVARFHADHGDYAVDDPKLLEALAKPGEHALVFTVAAGGETDLLDGTLRVGPSQADHDHGREQLLSPRLAGLAALALVAAGGVTAFVLLRRRRQGGLR
jgi:hypothetical protein